MSTVKFHIPNDRNRLYKVIEYPAGEIQVRLTEEGIAMVTHPGLDEIEITANPIPNVIELAQLNDAVRATAWLRTKSLPNIRLFLPYLPYARADRRFVDGDTAGFLVFMRLIESMEFTSVWTFDAHNAREAQAFGVANMRPTDEPIDQLRPILRDMGHKGLVIVLPDAGAAKRYADIGQYKIPFIVASKVRDAATGALTGFKIGSGIKNFRSALIVDDICDGGGTFLGLAEVIRSKNPKIRLGLYVSHGIFSQGINPLLNKFDEIYTSDYSIKNKYREYVKKPEDLR